MGARKLGVRYLDRDETRAAATGCSKYGDKLVRLANGGLPERCGCNVASGDCQRTQVERGIRIVGWERRSAEPHKGRLLGRHIDFGTETSTHPLGQDLCVFADDLKILTSPYPYDAGRRRRRKQAEEMGAIRMCLVRPIGQELLAEISLDDCPFEQFLDQPDRSVQEVRGHG